MVLREVFTRLGLDVDEAAFGVADAAIGGLQKGMLALGATFGAAIAGLAGVVKSTAAAGDHFDDASKAAGVSSTALQELSYAAKFAGLSSDEVGLALQHLGRNAAGAAGGSGEAAGAFTRLGIALKGADGKLRGADVLMGELAARFADMPDGAEKTALAMQLFGRSGARLIPVLNGGQESLAALAAEARSLGVILDEEAVARSAEFEDTVDRLGSALTGLKYTIGAPLLKPLAEAAQGVVTWVAANREWLASGITTAVQGLAAVIRGLGRVLAPVLAVLRKVASSTTLLTAAFTALALVAAVQLGGAIRGLLLALPSLSTLLTGASAGTWGLVRAQLAGAATALAWLAPIGLLVLLLEDLATWAEGGESLFGDLMKKLNPKEGEGFLPKFLRGLFDLEQGLPQLLAWLKEAFGDLVVGLADWVADVFGATLSQRLRTRLMAAAGGVASLGMGDFGGALAGGATALFGGGASPAASVAASPGVRVETGKPVFMAPTLNANINVNAAPGMSATDVAGKTREALEEFHATKLQEAHSAVSQ